MAEATEHNETAVDQTEERAIEISLSSFGVVKSTTQGRIRLQLNPEYRTPETLARLKTQLEQDERISEVTINPRTGSVIVKHSHQHQGHRLLSEALKEAELVAEVALEVEPIEEEGEGEGEGGGEGGQAKLDQQIADLMYRFDRFLYRRSGGRIHARGRVVPLGIAGLGVAQIAAYGISLEMLPGPMLFWIAFDIHRRFTKEHPYSMTDEEISDTRAAAEAEASKSANSTGLAPGGPAPAAA